MGVFLLVFWPGSLGFWWLRAVGNTRMVQGLRHVVLHEFGNMP